MTHTGMPSTSVPKRGRLAQEKLQWAFQLDGNFGWMQSFTDHFMSVDVVILVEHEDDRPPYYDFSSPHLNGLTGSQARQRANELLILFNGTMRAYFGADFHDFTIGEGRDLLSRGPIVNDYRDTEPLPAFPDDVEDLRYYRSHWELDKTGQELFLSRTDGHLRYIFLTLGREGLTFSSLYKVMETMKDYLEANGSKNWKADLAALGKKTASDIGDFTYTANQFGVAGYNARHGMDRTFKPASKNKAVTLSQAIDILMPIVRGFVHRRVCQGFGRAWEAVLIDRAVEAEPPVSLPEVER
jgi:hypothetical protein